MNSDDEPKDKSKRTPDELTPREREALKRRFGIHVNAKVTLADVAKQFDITREKIRELEKRARERHGPDDDPNEPE